MKFFKKTRCWALLFWIVGILTPLFDAHAGCKLSNRSGIEFRYRNNDTSNMYLGGSTTTDIQNGSVSGEATSGNATFSATCSEGQTLEIKSSGSGVTVDVSGGSSGGSSGGGGGGHSGSHPGKPPAVIDESKNGAGVIAGASVECNWKGENKYYLGTVKKVSGDSVDVQYADGDKEQTKKKRCRVPFKVGARVKCHYQGQSTLYPGKVKSVSKDGELTIHYDDGDEETTGSEYCVAG